MQPENNTSFLDDVELVKIIQNCEDCSNEAIKELIERHTGIFTTICKKYSGASSSTYLNLFENRDYVIYSAAASFKEDMGSKFSTWLANQTRYFCLNSFSKEKKYHFGDQEEMDSFFIQESNKEFKKVKDQEEEAFLIEKIKGELQNIQNQDVKQVVEMRYFSEGGTVKTFSEIARELGVTAQTVINRHEKFISFVKNKFDLERKMNTIKEVK
jgi:RNA polymerase sigma factor (sigma-70 family)